MPMSGLKQAKVLIVDDEKANIRFLEVILERAGYSNVYSTNDSRETVPLFASMHPDIVLLDLSMPHLDGFAVIQLLQPLMLQDAVPILMLTADITATVKHRALGEGAKDFLTKPLDEIEVLLRINNLLETRLLHSQLQHHNLILEQRVSERTQELLNARDAALEGSRLKSEFLQTISHELRTPLAQVIGMNEMLLDMALDAAQAEIAGVVQDSANHLLQLIESLLDFSKLESGRVELTVADFAPRSLIEELITLLGPSAREKSVDLHAEVASSVPARIRGDAHRLRQVVLNLMSNAVKFTEKGEVYIRVACMVQTTNNLTLHMTVRDTGIGLSDVAKARLFLPLTQADGSMTRTHGGVGLGLAICKRLVEMMGGEIGAESVEGQGSTFWFTIQLAPAAN